MSKLEITHKRKVRADLNKKAKGYIQKHNLKLPPRFKERWLEALDSGKYQKGIGDLCSVDIADYRSSSLEEQSRFCCLGVAGRIQGIPEEAIYNKGFLEDDIILIGKKSKRNIPQVLHGENPVTTFLAHRNDETRTFKEVRNWIDKNL
jgi:hypothetical protein